MNKKLVMLMVFVVTAFAATAELQFSEGRWRIELSGGPGIYSGGSDRSGDFLLKGMVEYEVPVGARCTLGLRMLPLFVYTQDESGENTVWGGGLGVGGRIYSVKDEYRGWFAELGAHALGHTGRISDNSSNVNFMTHAGVGYKCKANWHTVVRWEHLSNAHLGRNNAGANVVSLGFGYTF